MPLVRFDPKGAHGVGLAAGRRLCGGVCGWGRRVRFMLRYNEELDRFFDPHSKDRLAAAQAAKNAQQYLMQLAEDRDRRMRIREHCPRRAHGGGGCRARVYLEEVEKRKETLPDVLKRNRRRSWPTTVFVCVRRFGCVCSMHRSTCPRRAMGVVVDRYQTPARHRTRHAIAAAPRRRRRCNAGIYRECAAGLADQVRNYFEKAEREGRLRQALNERGSSR